MVHTLINRRRGRGVGTLAARSFVLGRSGAGRQWHAAACTYTLTVRRWNCVACDNILLHIACQRRQVNVVKSGNMYKVYNFSFWLT